MAHPKPIIGIVGGIGSGKSFVADILGELGCRVIRSDEHVHEAYRRDDVKQELRRWWGDRVFTDTGEVNRRAVADIIFHNPEERLRLEGLIHPIAHAERDREMAAEAANPAVIAFVWDIPLLVETGLNAACDCIVFVDATREVRLERLKGRGWSEGDLLDRENLQLPLDKKRSISDYYISNDDGVDVVREQTREVLSRILTGIDEQTLQA